MCYHVLRDKKPSRARGLPEADLAFQNKIEFLIKETNLMSKPKILYHYTSLENAKKIITSGYIKKTPSNLIRPRNLQIIGDAWADPATDNYFPVVWMTSSTSPEGHGLEVTIYRDIKKRVRISIPMKPYYTKWYNWSKQHNMDPIVRKQLTRGFNWQSWYVSDLEIPLKNVSEILDLETNTPITWQ